MAPVQPELVQGQMDYSMNQSIKSFVMSENRVFPVETEQVNRSTVSLLHKENSVVPIETETVNKSMQSLGETKSINKSRQSLQSPKSPSPPQQSNWPLRELVPKKIMQFCCSFVLS